MLRKSRLRFLRWLADSGGKSVYVRGDATIVAWLDAHGYVTRNGYEAQLTDKGRAETTTPRPR